MDRRTEKTRQSIIDAFVKLTNKSGYEKVSVKDIIQEANIGRSTFYDHFETKDELARYICIPYLTISSEKIYPYALPMIFLKLPLILKTALPTFSTICAIKGSIILVF